MNVVAYLRVSTESQLDGYGLDAQEAAVRTFCEQRGYDLAEMPDGSEAIFREYAISGKNELDDRIALVELNDYCDEHDVSTIVIPQLSRLARDLMVQESIIRDWERRGWTTLSTMEPDLAGNDPTRKFIRQVLGAVNEYDRAMIIARMRSGRIAKARGGQPSCGRVPLGYVAVESAGKRERRVDEVTAEVIRTIFQLRFQANLSLQHIADRLNETGVQPPKSDKWWKTTVGAILRNTKYRGVVEYREDGQTLAETYNDSLRLV